MKRFLITFMLILVAMVVAPVVTLAQTVVDTTQINPLPAAGTSIWDWISWVGVILVTVIYPIAVRLIPTTKNWDWLSGLMRILALLFPNKKKGGGYH